MGLYQEQDNLQEFSSGKNKESVVKKTQVIHTRGGGILTVSWEKINNLFLGTKAQVRPFNQCAHILVKLLAD